MNENSIPAVAVPYRKKSLELAEQWSKLEQIQKVGIRFILVQENRKGILLLKFQDDCTTLIATFEDFILLVYKMIDDLYQRFVPASVLKRRNVGTAELLRRKSSGGSSGAAGR